MRPAVRLDSTFGDHPDIVSLSDAAFRLHVCGLLYAARWGVVPEGAARRMTSTAGRAVMELVESGLWEPSPGGYLLDLHQPGVRGGHVGPTALYRLFDEDGALLYVGVTQRLQRRLGSHRREKPWWGLVDHWETEWFDRRQDALKAETHAIKTERPMFNEVHKAR